MALQDSTIKSLKRSDKMCKVYDAFGLYLEIPKKAKAKPKAQIKDSTTKKERKSWPSHFRWRFKYLFHVGHTYTTKKGEKKHPKEGQLKKSEQLVSLGTYPEVSLAEARAKRDQLRAEIAKGVNPAAEKKQQKARIAEGFAQVEKEVAEHIAQAEKDAAVKAYTLKVAALAWTEENASKHSEITTKRRIARFNNHLFPLLGDVPMSQITTQELRAAMKEIEKASTDFAHRILVDCKDIWRLAEINNKVSENIARELEPKHDLLPIKRKNHKAITEPSQLAALLKAIENYSGNPMVRMALRLAPFVFVRPGELRLAQWRQIDWQACTWTFTTAPNKGAIEHIVPLSSQVMAILTELRSHTGMNEYVFGHYGKDKQPLSEAALGSGLKRLGFGDVMVPHGFRATARTLIAEVLEIPTYLIERQLAHGTKESLGAAYDRTKWLKQRTVMMQEWADYLDALRTGSNVIPISLGNRAA
jgi:integrase